MYRLKIVAALVFLFSLQLTAQPDRWQQRVEYQMEIDFNVKTHRFTGKQKLVYYNNSPDQLDRVFYHLYFNAFQPGSMMDVYEKGGDAFSDMETRISSLKENEIGYHKILSLTQDGETLQYELAGTILEVQLVKPILPHSSVVFEMEFESQVPLQIRRSGRDNREGIDYSMAQWYPKMCEYDYQGWHANPYIGKEFYGVWGDFDVKIRMDKKYIIGSTGYLQNPDDIGYGYGKEVEHVKPKGKTLEWHFVAKNVHDFVWAADRDYTHTVFTRANGMEIHCFFQKNGKNDENWKKLPGIMDVAFDFINATYGEYSYKKYAFIQGGDGGMEYPMATLITGNRGLSSLVGVSVHELLHSWFQMALGTNESLYPWMDEGFTNYAEEVVINYLKTEKLIPGKPADFPHASPYSNYMYAVVSGIEEPLSTHADHYVNSSAYWIGAYSKGAVFLGQLQYIIGREAFDQGMLDYYDTWKFKHPNPNDFIRIMEKKSGLELDWYLEYWINTTHSIDYEIESVETGKNKSSVIRLKRLGQMPMPLDVFVLYEDDSFELFNIPLRIMRGSKSLEFSNVKYTVLEDWPWTNTTYEFAIERPLKEIKEVLIDPTMRLADIASENSRWENNK